MNAVRLGLKDFAIKAQLCSAKSHTELRMQCCWYYKGLPSKPSSVQLSHTQRYECSAGTEKEFLYDFAEQSWALKAEL